MTSVRFPVTAGMAPLGRLLAYYVRENGEGVTDSLQFAVEPSFENQVSGLGRPRRDRGCVWEAMTPPLRLPLPFPSLTPGVGGLPGQREPAGGLGGPQGASGQGQLHLLSGCG